MKHNIHFESESGIGNVGELVAYLEQFPDNLPVCVGGKFSITAEHVLDKASECARARKGAIVLKGDDNG